MVKLIFLSLFLSGCSVLWDPNIDYSKLPKKECNDFAALDIYCPQPGVCFTGTEC